MWFAFRRLSLGLCLIGLASAVLLLSDANRRDAPQELRRIAILQHASQPIIDEGVQGMLQGLAETGYVVGRNLSVRRYNAENDVPTANAMASEMVSGPYDMVMTATTLSLQAVANAKKPAR